MNWVVVYDVLDPQVLWGPVLIEVYALAVGSGLYWLTCRLPKETSRGVFARRALLLFAAILLLVTPLQAISTLELRRDFRAGRYATQNGVVTAVDVQHSGRHAQTTLLFRVGGTWLQMPNYTRSRCLPKSGDLARVAFSLQRRTAFSREVNPAMRIELSANACEPAG